MAIQSLNPADAMAMSATGAVLIDIRSPDEFRRAHAIGARNTPLDQLVGLDETSPVVFMCQSGMRTASNLSRIEASCTGESYFLEGGLNAWKSAGLPVAQDKSQPLELMRQVQITAGSLVLIGVLLGTFVASPWYGLSAFGGAGLAFAGATGWCGMANLLLLMPWNKRAAT